MTDTPITDRTEADLHPAPPPQRPPSLIARVHHDLAAVGHVVTRNGGTVKTTGYVAEECRSLARQAAVVAGQP